MKNFKSILTTAVVASTTVVLFLVVGASLISKQVNQKIHSSQIASFKMNRVEVITNLFLRRITLNDVELIDTTSSDSIYIPEVKIEGIRLLPLIFKKKLVIDNVIIKNPNVVFNEKMRPSGVSESKKSGKKETIIQIQKVEITNAKLFICKLDEQAKDTLFATALNLEIWDLSTDTPEKNYAFKNSSFDRLRLSLDDGKYFFPNELYSFQYHQLNFDSESAGLEIDQAKLVSCYSKYEIGKKRGVETDWFDFTFDGFEMNDIRLNSLLNDTALIFREARLQNFSAKAFKDKRLPFPEKPDTKLPMEMLDDLPFSMHCDSFLIDQAAIEYSERVTQSDKAGVVTFHQLQAKIYCLSNIDRLITQPSSMTIRAKVMDEAFLFADFIFPNKKYPKAYQATGTLNSMSIASFNPMLMQNASLRVKDGRIKQLAFNFQYNNNQSTGDLLFEYDKLKVVLLHQDDDSDKNFKSFLINSFVLHKENLSENKSFRKGTISFDRDKKKSVFNYWWKSILSGLKSIAVL